MPLEIDTLVEALDQERARSIAGVESDPGLVRLYAAHSRVAHRQTVTDLREAGQAALAARVAALRAERAAAEHEERWRALEAAAHQPGPDGDAPLAALELAVLREPDRTRRLALARAAADALEPAAAAREAAVEARARAGAEVGLAPDWRAVVEGDQLLAASDDAWREVLGFRARHDLGLAPSPGGDLTRGDLLFLLTLSRWDGLFRPAALRAAVHATVTALGLDLSRLRIDEGTRPAQWPGVHVVGARVAWRPRGGAGDWQDLLAGLPRALAATHASPHRREPLLGHALGWLVESLLLEPRWLADHAGVERKVAPDLIRDLALRRLFTLRARAAAFRIATEVERGLSGAAWREAYREALTAATGAAWEGVRAARDADGAAHAAALAGAGAGEALRLAVREQLDEDWWRNPRTAAFLAGLLAGGALPDPEAGAPREPALAAQALAARLEGSAR
ncbi:MAG: hypothetical protein QM767_29710 [Anaeromyxobacter sp.]